MVNSLFLSLLLFQFLHIIILQLYIISIECLSVLEEVALLRMLYVVHIVKPIMANL